MTDLSWRGVYSERFLERAIQRPPRPEPVRPYVRPSDEDIAALPEHFHLLALLTRSLHDNLRKSAARVAQLGATRCP